MRDTGKISAQQLFAMLIVLRIVIMMTADTVLLGGENLIDNVLSCAIALGMNGVLILPLYALNRRGRGTNLLEKSYGLFGRMGALVAGFYILYFLFVDCYYLSFFHVFTVNVLDPKIPSWLIVAAVIAVAVYAAFQGLEAIARTSLLVLVVILASLGFLFFATLSRVDMENVPPLLYRGTGQMWVGVLQFLGRSTGFSILAMLLPQTTGNRKLGFVVWNLVIYGVLSLALFILSASMGSYTNTQLFPFYLLAEVGGIGPFQRLDTVFIGVWISGLFLKIALDLYLISRCMIQMAGARTGKASIVGAAVAVGVAAVFVSNTRALYQLVFSLKVILPFTFGAAFLVPLILLIVDITKGKGLGKERKGVRYEEKQSVQKDGV